MDGDREDAEQVREYPVRFTDIDLFDHMNNAVYWSVVEDYLSTRPELLGSPLRVTIEHEAPIALGDKLEILAHTHPAGSTDRFGAGHRQVIWEWLWRSRCEWIGWRKVMADCVFQAAAATVISSQTAKRLVISVRHWGALIR